MHKRKLIRLSGFDYSANRNYFFTICVQNHSNTFGSIVNKSMFLSEKGIIAMEQWYWLHDQYPYIDLISFVIMPDHVHGIIYIDTNFYKHYVGNDLERSLRINQTNPKIKPLPELIGAYKTTVSKRIHMMGELDFRWQKSYYEHIIRNQRSLNLIKHYIEANPENWIM